MNRKGSLSRPKLTSRCSPDEGDKTEDRILSSFIYCFGFWETVGKVKAISLL